MKYTILFIFNLSFILLSYFNMVDKMNKKFVKLVLNWTWLKNKLIKNLVLKRSWLKNKFLQLQIWRQNF